MIGFQNKFFEMCIAMFSKYFLNHIIVDLDKDSKFKVTNFKIWHHKVTHLHNEKRAYEAFDLFCNPANKTR